ncbi:putative leucine-rich repeat domain superfamily [Helianthus annuus]|nr:putative leucine-rich repeat domain superfamily [Helianthus annuus]
MHDLMNDLATSVATEFYLRLDNVSEKSIRMEMLEKYRHMSFVREEYVGYKKFEAFERAKSLRTFMATSVGEVEVWQTFYFSNKILIDLLPQLPMLRVLCLRDFQISEVPESIGTSRHLSLPNAFLKLKNLRHLDVRDTPLLFQMLLGIGNLKNLQITISKIVIRSENGFEIAKLKDFKNLCGKISIVGLEKVQNAIYAHEANFSQKMLSDLKLVWSDELHDSRNEMLEKEVLNELNPCDDKLIQLEIRSYGGVEFPKWVGDPLFLHLNHVSISGCKRCTSLPPIGKLPSLKGLFIKGLCGVEVVGFELFGTGPAFPSLEVLSFIDMRKWNKWSGVGVVFPHLQKLQIRRCPNLVEVTLEALPSLNLLDTKRCNSGVLRSLVELASTVTKLEINGISGLNDVVWRGVMEYLRAVVELSITYCNETRYLWESEAVASKVLIKLRKLEVADCDNLVNLGEKEEDNCRNNLLTSLRILEVFYCKNMDRCSCPDGIEELTVLNCSSMTVVSFPTGGLEKLRSLRINDCKKLLEREWGGQKVNNNESSMPMLECVWISNWPNLKSIIGLNFMFHLTTLRIHECESLESFPDNLTSLKNLEIRNCPSMDASFPRGVWPPKLHSLRIGKLKKPISEWGPQNFPTSLVELWLYGDEDGASSCEFSHLLPSSLTFLGINEFEKLESFSMGLQHLTSLGHLYFNNCPNLKV